MDGWMDEWMDGWMDGWMDRWMDESGWMQPRSQGLSTFRPSLAGKMRDPGNEVGMDGGLSRPKCLTD